MKQSTSSGIYRIDKTTWRIRWDEYIDGKRKQHSRTIHGTRNEAERELTIILAGTFGVTETVNFKDYWELVVLPEIADLATKTREEYIRLWERELAPMLNYRLVANTDFRVVQVVIDSIEAPTVQRHAFALLRKIMNLAIRDGLLFANPCTRHIKFAEHRKSRKTTLGSTEICAFLDCIKGVKYEPLVLVCLGGGLRPEEAYALMWDDVRQIETRHGHFVAVDVNKARVSVSGGSETKATKTEHSTRTVVIGEPFAARLLELKTTGAVCDGQPTTIAHNWRLWLKRRDMPAYPFAVMRSNYATLCGEAGCQDSMVSLMMGHTDGTTRGKNYQSATLDGLSLVALTLENHLC